MTEPAVAAAKTGVWRMYAPKLIRSRTIRRHDLGPDHVGVLMTDILAEGSIQYAYLLAILRRGIDAPIAYVSSEAKPRRRYVPLGFEDRTGSHFLCSFTPCGHMNYGASDDWGDEATFEARALEMAKTLI
ncbi:hypothetical protein [Methylobacterium sp. ARG-1]|uniref:hypothetical protein n=1 Tax=Methylobacterium sp. ARG-1 TaxID=1692501 RepID=UPI0006824EDD|nr:hypothetical protein [Methylobacterium sp. ARG-1]KNY20591.1 hypothetical protein AKJ13_21590 [Methylobacterium sp. ARG-1]